MIRKPVSLEVMRHLAKWVGSELTDAQLDDIRPALEDLRQRIVQLDELGLEDSEPASVYRLKGE